MIPDGLLALHSLGALIKGCPRRLGQAASDAMPGGTRRLTMTIECSALLILVVCVVT